MKQPDDSHVYRYWVLRGYNVWTNQSHYWDGKDWRYDQSETRQYKTWIAARVAQCKLANNSKFREGITHCKIEGINPRYVQLTIYDALREINQC
jgi:hypothetical protein